MITWEEAGTGATPVASMTWAYDAADNIRRTTSDRATIDTNGTAGASSPEPERWYTYDAMNPYG